MTQCEAIGELTVGGRPVAAFRCELEAGHSDHIERDGRGGSRPYPSRHRYVLEWADDDETMMLPEASLFDPDERFDVDVPLEP